MDKKYKVYIGNIDGLNKLDNSEIVNLIDNFNQTLEINSIQIFKDSIHIELSNENEARNLANFFNNFQFKSYKLKSFLIENNKKSTNSENENSFKLSSTNLNISKKNRYYKSNLIDCEIYVSNRQLKRYADSVNDKLCKELFGLRTHIRYLSDESNSEKFDISFNFLKDSLNLDLLYLVYLNEKNEQFNSINLFILNKWRLIYLNGATNLTNLHYSIKGIYFLLINLKY